MIGSFHTNLKGPVQFYGSSSGQFDIRSGVKQGYSIAHTLFEIFFGLILNHAIGIAIEGI